MATDIERLVVSLDADITRLSRQLAKATGDFDTWGVGIEKKARGVGKGIAKAVNDNTGFRPDQWKNLGFQLNDAITQLGTGSGVLQTFAAQGGQIQGVLGDHPGGIAGGMREIASKTMALLTPARLVAGGMAGIALSAALIGINWAQAEEKIERGLSGVGRKAGATVRDVYRIADAVAATGTMSSGEARDVVSSLAQSGRIDKAQLGSVASLAPGFAKLFGKDMADVGPELARIFSDPIKGADELDARLGSLSGKTRELIRNLVEQGDRQGAINALIAAVKPDLDEVALKTSGWAKAWNAVKSGADAAAVAIGRAISKAPPEERAQAAERRKAGAEARMQGSPFGPAPMLVRPQDRGITDGSNPKVWRPEFPVEDLQTEIDRAGREAADATIEALNKTLVDEIKRDDKIGNERSQAATEAAKALNAEGESLQTLENRYAALGKALEDKIALGKIDDPDRARASYEQLSERLKQLRADYAAGGQAAANALRQANFQNAVAGTSTYARGLLEINKQFDELRRNLIATTDLAKLPEALAANETARGLATKAYNTDARERAKNEVSVSPDIAKIVFGAEGNNPAKNPLSSASGYGQFIDSTFLSLYKKEFSNLAAGMTDAAILGMKQDKTANERLVEAYARENAVALNRAGLDGNRVENQYLAHFLGGPGAIAALQADRGANAESVLGSKVARANPTIVGGGKTVGDVIDYAYGRAQRYSATGRSQEDAARRSQQEAEAHDKSTAAAARLQAINELLNADREKGGELGLQYKSAEEMLRAKVDELTPALKAQREEWIKLAEERANAAAKGAADKSAVDLTNQYQALGRTSSEQQSYQQAKQLYAPGTEAFDKAYDSFQRLRDVTDVKNYTGGFLKDMAADLSRGTKLADAFRNASQRLLSTFLNKGIDSLVSKAFGAMLGDGGGASGAGGLGSLFSGLLKAVGLGAAEGGRIAGPGTGTSDSVLARLSNGEYVVNAAATREHLPILEAINARRFVRGGLNGAVPRIGTVPHIPLARPAAGGGTTIIDQRTNAPPIDRRRNARGGETLTIRDLDDALARNAKDGGSSLSDIFGGGGNPAFMNG